MFHMVMVLNPDAAYASRVYLHINDEEVNNKGIHLFIHYYFIEENIRSIVCKVPSTEYLIN